MHISVLWFLMLLLCPCMSQTTTAAAETSSVRKPGCRSECGNVTIPYPFGIGYPGCAMNEFFNLTCNDTSTPAKLIYGKNILVRNLSIDEGTMNVGLSAARACYNETGLEFRVGTAARLGPLFRFSDTRTKFTVFGCDTVASMKYDGGNFSTGCSTLCKQNITKLQTCPGFGCSQMSVPRNLRTINVSIRSWSNHSEVLSSNPCGYAFLTDNKSFSVVGMNLSYYPYQIPTSYSVLVWDKEENNLRSNVTIEWIAENKTCKDATENKASYACRDNTECNYSENGQGYRCKCLEGFEGNPYLEENQGGCKDINECQHPKAYPCDGSCKNTPGNYTCSCPLGMRGDGKVGSKGFRVTAIVAVIGAATFTVIITVLILIIYQRQRKQRNFLENGGMLLKQQRIRIFSEAELTKATKDYDKDWFLGEGGFGSVHKGVLDDNTIIAVKKPKKLGKNPESQYEIADTKLNKAQEFQHEIGIVSQVNHKNVVKLLGLCLETKVPLLVYEFISNGTLYDHIHKKKSQILSTWKNCLRVATEIALALDYLHSLADPPIIHGDVKSMNILLDDNFTAKVSDFGASVLIPPNHHSIITTKIQGTPGYLDPEYLMTGELTERSDVYSFGVVLVELLTGKKPNSRRSGEKMNIHYFLSSLDNNDLSQALPSVLTNNDEMEEIKVVAELAKRCLSRTGIERPTMKQAAEELARLQQLRECSWNQKSSKETDPLLDQSSYNVANAANSFSVTSFEVEYSPDSV